MRGIAHIQQRKRKTQLKLASIGIEEMAMN